TVADNDAVRRTLQDDLVQRVVVLDVLQGLTLLDRVQRRLRDEHVAALDQLLHVAEEEREQQGADVAAIHVGGGHQDDLAVTLPGEIEVVLAAAGPERGDHGANFFVAEHLVITRFFYVENFSFQRQDGLEAPVAALLGGAAGGFSLDQKQFAALRLAFGTIRQLAGKAAAVECAFSTGEVAGFAGGLASARRFNGFVDDLPSDRRILLEVCTQTFVHERLHDAGDIGIQFAFGLAFKLGLRQLHADDRDEAL